MPPSRVLSEPDLTVSFAAGVGSDAALVAPRSTRDRLRTVSSWLSTKVVADLSRIADFLCVGLTGWAVHLAVAAGSETAADLSQYSLAILLGAVMIVNGLQLGGVYHPDLVRRPLSQIKPILTAVTLVAGVLLAIAYVTGASHEFSRLWAALWIGGSTVGLVGMRLGLVVIASERRAPAMPWLQRRVAIVGAGAEAERALGELAASEGPWCRVVGIFDDGEPRAGERGPATDGTIADLCALAQRVEIDRVIVAKPWSDARSLLDALRRIEVLPVDIRLLLPPLPIPFRSPRVSYLHRAPVIHVVEKPLGDWGRLVKFLEDRLLGGLACLVFAPVMLAIGLAIRLDTPGPALFRQKRIGFNSQVFEVLKFRTMRHELSDAAGAQLTRAGDVRITRVGAFLRRTSLDELPQLLNVIRGEMSLVGPRPHALEAKAADRLYHEVIAGYAARHKIKPGITGWAQINGWRGPTINENQIRNRVEHDLFYIENWSLWLDVRILALTAFKGWSGANAY